MSHREVLRAPYALRLLTGTLLGRLPNATAAIALVLFVRGEGGSYATAGAVVAAYGLATAVGQPALGRLVDKHGQPRVELPAAVASAAAATVLAMVGIAPVALAVTLAAAAGLTAPPLEGALRALWPSVLSRRDDLLHTAYALDAVAQEVMFAGGPVILTLCAAAWSPPVALVIVHVVGVIGTVSVVVSRPSRSWRSAPRSAHWLGPLRSPGLRRLLAGFLLIGAALGSIAVTAVAYADDGHGGTTTYGTLTAALALGALVGGTIYGTRPWPGTPQRRLQVLAALLAVCYLPLIATPDALGMIALSVVAGLFLAPVMACSFVVIDRYAPSGTVTEAFSWLVTTFTVGSSVGSALAGPLVEHLGIPWGYALPPCCAGLGSLLLLTLTRAPAAPRADDLDRQGVA